MTVSPMEKAVTISVKLQPRSSRNQVVGREGDIYRIKVTAPPVDGKANAALVKLLAKKLGIPPKKIDILSGHASRLKTIRIQDLSLPDVSARLDQPF